MLREEAEHLDGKDTSKARADVSSGPVQPPGPSSSSEIVEPLTSSHHADVRQYLFYLQTLMD